MFWARKYGSNGSDTESSENNEYDSNDYQLSPPNLEIKRDGQQDWCVCGNCKKVERDLHQFQKKRYFAWINSYWKMFWLGTWIKGCFGKRTPCKKSLQFSAYKQFFWWIYQKPEILN